MNGGFEAARDDLPLNCLVYTPDTVPSADFALALDTEVAHSGRRSLPGHCRRAGA